MRMGPTATAVTAMLIVMPPAAAAVTGGCSPHPEAGPVTRSAARNLRTTEGQSFTGKVADIGAYCSLASATITWGDGTETFETIAAAPAGGFDLSETHTYDPVGSYPVS
jgi:hypothetical protein